MARDETNSGMSGDRQILSYICARPCAVTRPWRESPEPLTSTQPVVSTPWFFMTSRTAWPLLDKVAPAPFSSAPRVRKVMRAITLLLFLLIWRITSDSQGESCQTSVLALDGALPDTKPRAMVPP